jgi:hypothetical protein
MKYVYTHYGYMVGCDARTPAKFKKRVNLRETKTMWITESGTKFSKKTLCVAGCGDWPLYELQPEPTRKEIHNDNRSREQDINQSEDGLT